MAVQAPIIGIIACRRDATGDWPLEHYGLPTAYTSAVIAAGGIPLMIPPSLDPEQLNTVLRAVDGLLIPGGGDIDPAVYGGEGHAKVHTIEPDRDRTEIAAARFAVKQPLPLLAICRGLQVLNVAFGGSLWEDVAVMKPGASIHDSSPVLEWKKRVHTVTVEEGSRLQSVIGQSELSVNSLHHQAVREVGTGLRVSAQSADGVVEAMEVDGHPFAVAVQWHPEHLVGDDPAMRALFEALVQASAIDVLDSPRQASAE